MYEITEYSGWDKATVVRMSFEMPYLDWCRFQKSDIFLALTQYLEELKTLNIPKMPLKKKD